MEDDSRRSFCGNENCPERPEITPEDSHLPAEERQPCPVCGSRARSFTKPVGVSITLGWAVAAAASTAEARGEALQPTIVITENATATDAIEVEKSSVEDPARVVPVVPTLAPAILEVLPGLAATHQALVVWAELGEPGGGGIGAVYSAYGGLLDTVVAESFDDCLAALTPALAPGFESPPPIVPTPADDDS